MGDIVFLDQFRLSAVQRYVPDLMLEIGGHDHRRADHLHRDWWDTNMCSMGVAHLLTTHLLGIQTLWFLQQLAAKNLLNVSTLSIVFGVVDASLLQCSNHMTGNTLANSVNMSWMSSSVFSIAAGVNGLLGLTWK